MEGGLWKMGHIVWQLAVWSWKSKVQPTALGSFNPVLEKSGSQVAVIVQERSRGFDPTVPLQSRWLRDTHWQMSTCIIVSSLLSIKSSTKCLNGKFNNKRHLWCLLKCSGSLRANDMSYWMRRVAKNSFWPLCVALSAASNIPPLSA